MDLNPNCFFFSSSSFVRLFCSLLNDTVVGIPNFCQNFNLELKMIFKLFKRPLEILLESAIWIVPRIWRIASPIYYKSLKIQYLSIIDRKNVILSNCHIPVLIVKREEGIFSPLLFILIMLFHANSENFKMK